MKSAITIAVAVSLFASAGPVLAGGPDMKAVAEHIRETNNVPSAVEISVGNAKKSDIPGFEKLEVVFTKGDFRQEEVLYLSKDGKHYVMGEFKDLSVNPDQDRLSKMDLKGAAIRGNKKAKVLVVEYTDFQCPFCQRGYEIMADQIMKEFDGKVGWIYKSLPLVNIHPWAKPAALAVECARLQSEDRFWSLHDGLFEQQRSIRFDNLDDKLAELGKAAKIDMAALNACRDANKTLPVVARDMEEAGELGITGTPAFVVNGHKVSGADYETLKAIVTESLAGGHGKL